MNLLHPPTLKALCARADLRPSKAAGQNFLIHGGTLAAIVDAVAPQHGETIVEVGAGFGVLTCALADRGARVIAIERDTKIVPILREQVAEYLQVEVVEGDILALLKHQAPSTKHQTNSKCKYPNGDLIKRHVSDFTFGALKLFDAWDLGFGASWRLVANLPYSITSDFLRLLFDVIGTGALPPPERVVLLLQHEVVERLLGRTPADVGLLTMIARLHCRSIHRIARVPASHFWPQPKVASAIVVLEGWRSPEEIADMLHTGVADISPRRACGHLPNQRVLTPATPVHRSSFLSLLTRAFSHPRRQLQNNLDLPPTAWAAADVAPTARPATLSLPQWIALARTTISPPPTCHGSESLWLERRGR